MCVVGGRICTQQDDRELDAERSIAQHHSKKQKRHLGVSSSNFSHAWCCVVREKRRIHHVAVKKVSFAPIHQRVSTQRGRPILPYAQVVIGAIGKSFSLLCHALNPRVVARCLCVRVRHYPSYALTPRARAESARQTRRCEAWRSRKACERDAVPPRRHVASRTWRSARTGLERNDGYPHRPRRRATAHGRRVRRSSDVQL